jgi:peptidoglycan hydrolase-like amidase
LCQAGAFARIKAGATPEDVLRYYYPGTIVGRGNRPTATDVLTSLIRRP